MSVLSQTIGRGVATAKLDIGDEAKKGEHMGDPRDNSVIEAFADEVSPVVNEWNTIHDEKQGRLVLRVEGGDKKYPEKKAVLYYDTGIPGRPLLGIFLAIGYDRENLVFRGTNPDLSSLNLEITIEKLQRIIQRFNPRPME